MPVLLVLLEVLSTVAEKEFTGPRKRLPLRGDGSSTGPGLLAAEGIDRPAAAAVVDVADVLMVSGGRLPMALGEEAEEDNEEDDEGDDFSLLPLPPLLLLRLPPLPLAIGDDTDVNDACFLGPVGRLMLKWHSTPRFWQELQGYVPLHFNF